jgi:UrcA family protein
MTTTNPTLTARIRAAAHSLATATLASATLALAAPAVEAADGAPTLTVRYADLDLSRPAGAEAMYERLSEAASRVCGPREARVPKEQLERRICREQAIARAVAQIDNAPFTAWYAAKLGRGPMATPVASSRN